MKKERIPKEEKPVRSRASERRERSANQASKAPTHSPSLSGLHRHIGNRGVQRLLAQRSPEGSTELDPETADRIDRERGGGEPLDGAIQTEMSEAMEYDLSGVRTHTSSEADTLSRRLGATAFTTGQDVFFREGSYDSHSAAGRELIAHELTHIAQQGTGMVDHGGRMTVSAPGDVHEQQADANAHAVVGSGANAAVQRSPRAEPQHLQMQEEEEEEEEEAEVQMQEEEEIQMQEEEEIQMQEEEEIQMQEEEEEELQP